MAVEFVRVNAVRAFLSALSIALKVASRQSRYGEQRDLFLLVDSEIQQFFELLPDHQNLNSEELKDLNRIREGLRLLCRDADLVMLDPSKETPQ